ncbi:uncharacterized protein LOC110728292 [Chenopodium quinoa]|uniref:uncharacterized protein LOC110728292 n=1 Tax=Chenopodium quinoa TaxID=63459 RepID=UPI000B794ACA|nr:uncharacterized protein LOC110728292 [Chenopodium quinoa]
MAISDKKFNEMMTHNKMIENQISQLAIDLKDQASPSSLPSQGLDPKKPVNAIVTRSGKVLEERLPRTSDNKEVPKEVLVENEGSRASLDDVVVETPREVRVEKEIVKPKLPYPQKFMRHKLDEQFGRFINMLKQLHLSLPFTDMINQMPKYAKFLKDILSGKRTSDVVETINLTENCSAIIMNKMPPKFKDPGNFSIPCAINKMQFDNALCDLGASHLLTSNDSLENVLLNKDKLGVPCKEVALYKELLNRSMEEVDEQLCLKITSHEALQAAATKEGKGVPMSQAQALCCVLRKHQGALGYTIDDLKGISPALCTHHITLEEGTLPSIERKRKLHPQMGEVVKKEITKLLDAGIIFPISSSRWVSPVHVVPKKGGMTVVKNESGEIIPTRTVTGWRMCIDYRRLNTSTKKDHFPLPFIDQMLERLTRHKFYCFLDGYSGFFRIPIHPKDQEKTTFTCPYGTFAYRRMPFWPL